MQHLFNTMQRIFNIMYSMCCTKTDTISCVGFYVSKYILTKTGNVL